MPTDRQRRETERRRAARQLQVRRERATRRRRINLIVSIVGALVVIAAIVLVVKTTSDDNSTPAAKSPAASPSAAPTTSAPTTSAPTSASAKVAAYPCAWKKAGTAARKVTVPPTTTPARKGSTAAVVQTTQGAMTFTLDRSAAPCAVENFLSLARQKYFDKTPCHRLVSSSALHVLQCGDPTGSGSGGPGYQFADELSGKEKYTRGVLAMANAGANTNGSQFFIVYGPSTLQPAYTVFGMVTTGLAVVDKVAAKGSTPTGDGKPKLPISITTVTAKG